MSAVPTPVRFVQRHDAFISIRGPTLKYHLLHDVSNSNLAYFHEACIYHPLSRSIFVTSNMLPNDPAKPSTSTSNKHIKLFRIYDNDHPTGASTYEEVVFPGIEGAMLNGGVNALSNSPNELIFCAQGSKSTSDLSGIVSLTIPAPNQKEYTVRTLVSNFHDIPFNSVNDVIVHPQDGSIWFTDPCYGHHQGIRSVPQLPNQVYRFDISTNAIRAVADGFTRPNGLCFSPDLQILYVTDTGAIHGSADVPIDPTGPSHIYAFDIITDRSGSPFLANRRLFAYAPGRFPDGIKCDTEGNVYSGCGDGIEVWSPQGVLIGTIKIEGGVANFCFGEKGVIYACNETRFWKIELDASKVKGALLGI